MKSSQEWRDTPVRLRARYDEFGRKAEVLERALNLLLNNRLMAMPGTVQSVSFSTHRRNMVRLDRPVSLRLLPGWDRITAAGQEPAGEKF
jgi:hypothetical protein